MPAIFALSVVLLILGLGILTVFYRHRRDQMFHRERMAAMDKGLPVPEGFWRAPTPSSSAYLLRGLIWLVIGIGVSIWFVAMYFGEGATDHEMLGMAAAGLIPAGVGVAYLIVRRVELRKAGGEPPV
jgi:hypothetical protein